MTNVKKGVYIELVSIVWMIIEAGVAIGAGLLAHSLALLAFGIDSIIELLAGLVLLWRLLIEVKKADLYKVESAEKIASWFVWIALLLLAAYILVASGYALWNHQAAETTALGLGIAVVSGIIMPYLSWAKKKIGGQIGSKALIADGSCSIVCAYMAWTVIIGVVFNALLGWWWIDSVTALALVYFVMKEGIEAIQEARGHGCGCGDSCEVSGK